MCFSSAMRLSALAACAVLIVTVLEVPTAEAVDGPTRVLLTPTADPSTSQFVSWSRSRATKGQEVVAIGSDGSVHRATARRKLGTTKRTAGSTQFRYVATLEGLQPDAKYRYRVAHHRSVTGWRSFRTAPEPGGAFTFLQFGDTQVDNAGVPQRIVDTAARRHRGAGLLLHAGDVVNHPWEGGEWRALHEALSPSGQSKNWLAAIGNHEQCRLLSPCRSGGGRGFRSYFHGASNGEPGQRHTWFHVDHGAARFIVLDSFGEDLARQRNFLRKALRTNTRRWSIVLMHSGPFASRGDRTNTTMRSAFLPTLEKYGADLVLSGHDHSYARGTKAGITYVTSVSGTKYYPSSAADWKRGGAVRTAAASRTATYQVVRVTPDRISVRAVVGHRGRGSSGEVPVGRVLDSFVLTD